MFNWFKRPAPAKVEAREPHTVFSTHLPVTRDAGQKYAAAMDQAIRMLPKVQGGTMDSPDYSGLKLTPTPTVINGALMDWYASQSFIGWQACAELAQHWLIDKACSMPARDATRNGWDAVTVDGDELDKETAKILKQYDKKYRVKWQAEQLVRMGRIFGIRMAIFKVNSTDPDYYKKPFNPDGIEPGSYKGISQVDPYWCAPLLDAAATSDPGSLHFYEPTFWIIGGTTYHRSHLHIFRTAEPPDVLKPMYMYGGIPLSQRIMERVYAAERTANEGPLLAMSKRTSVWLTNMAAFKMGGEEAIENLQRWIMFRDNHGIKMGDKEADDFKQFETSLADLDSVIMNQYQLVAAEAEVPATKLLGTTPKGFNSTGEYEESSYHESLESIQEHDLTPFIERHHLLSMLSEGKEAVETTVAWRPLDAPTAKELADTNLVKAQTDYQLIQAGGAISPDDVRRRVATDPDSGYFGLGADDNDPLAELGLSDEAIEAANELGIG
jgi:phage-related protein (TIGR01555 family)